MKYRCDSLFGDRYLDAKIVMAHEVFTLQNTDILDTLSSTILKDTDVGKEMENLSWVINSNNTGELVNEGYFNLVHLLDKYYDNEELGAEYFTKVLDKIKELTHKDIQYVLWLCDTKEDVINEYDMHHELTLDDIDCYEESDIILSDIGRGGKLYGYCDKPLPCNI